MFTPHLAAISIESGPLNPHALVPPAYFTAAQLRTIYQIPTPSTSSYTVAVISFGGGLYGSVDAGGVLTGGDVQAYWSSLGIPTAQQPRVMIVPLAGASNQPNVNDGGATMENTIDIEMIGGICPSPTLTIILYLAPNRLSSFPTILQAILASTPPQAISCSWGAPEIAFSASLLASITTHLQTATAAGITMCVATGDNGSTDGVLGGGNHLDFPSSHPLCLAVGGTTLVCPSGTWDSQTIETAWTYGGGGISAAYPRPAYQAALSPSIMGRATPDIAAVADPATGVIFTIHGASQVVGGTSIAAPLLAGFLAAINNRQFVTPLLYALSPSVRINCFHDMTGGSNGGYSAQIGFDQCTGWGSIQGIALAAALAPPPPPLVTSITLFPTIFSMVAGTTASIKATIAPVGASTALTWSSSQPAIATTNGLVVTARSAGTAVMTAQAQDGSGVTAQVTVTVTAPLLVATALRITPLAATLHPGATAILTATVTPVGVPLTWTTTSGAVQITISGTQVTILARTVGTATITVRAGTGATARSANATITVIQPVTSITLAPSAATLLVGASRTLAATVLPSTAPNRAITWASSASSVVSVNAGRVTAISVGSATITATSVDSPSIVASCTISVTAPLVLRITAPSQMNRGAQAQIQLQPTDAPVTWRSMLPSVLTVSPTGLLTAHSNGLAMITVQAQGQTATATIRVTTTAIGIQLSRTQLTIPHGLTATLQATVLPIGASNAGVVWSSSRNLIATVQGGVVRGNIAGQVIITATAVEGGWTATCAVTVT